MKRILTLLAAAALSQAAFANLLTNPGLDDPIFEGDTAPGWTMVEINNDGNAFDTGLFVAFANHTPSGWRGLWFRSFMGGPSWGSPVPVDCILTQTVAGTPGQEYTLSAWYYMENGYSGLNPAEPTQSWLTLEFLDAGNNVIGNGNVDIDNLYVGRGTWQQFSTSAVAPAGTVTVRVGSNFQNGVIQTLEPQSAFVDDFELTAQAGPPSISGTVNLLDLVGVCTDPVKWELFDGTNMVANGTTTLGSGGSFSISPSVPGGSYMLAMTGRTHLRDAVAVNTSTGNVSGVSYSLTNGDVDQDNEVGPGDFGALATAFLSVDGDPNWNALADLDCDGEVGPGDFGILASNFLAAGWNP